MHSNDDGPSDAKEIFPPGDSELACLIRSSDWSTTSLGPLEQWPRSLKTVTALVVQSPVPMVTLWGPSGVMIYNDAYSMFAGKRHPNLLGSEVRKGWPEVAEFNDNVMHVGLAGGTLSYKDQELTLYRTGRPEQVWMNLDYSPVVGDDGRPAGVIAVVVETTQRVLADQRLATEVERQRQVFQQMPGFVGVLSGADHLYEYVNDAYVRIAGERHFVGRKVRDVFPELRGQGFFELLDTVYETGEPFTARAMPIRLEGENADRYIDFLYHAIRDNHGHVSGIFVGGYDVTEQVRAQEGLREANKQLAQRVEDREAALRDTIDFARLALSAVDGVGVWTYETDSDRFYCDEAISALYGIDPQLGEAGILRHDFLANIHPDDRSKLTNTMEQGLRRSGDLEMEYRIRHPDGSTRWVLSRGNTYFDEDNRPVRRTGVGIDMTKQRLLEEQLRQSQKMEAVGQLTGGLAHDFNNLLTGITGSIELLQTRLSQGRLSDVDRYAVAALGAARRAAALTHRLLAFSRRQTLDPKPTDVNRLVSGMEDLIRRTVGPAVQMEIVAAGGLWPTLVDPPQLESALLNLCINARDAMPDGGRITIETGNRWFDQRAADELSLDPGQYISLCVSDTGSGMPPDVIAKAFDPFFTTKPIGQGTGLGLSMIYGFVQQSDGQIRIYSEVGQGTNVCLYLPRHVGNLLALEVARDLSDAPRAEIGESVLVVDDEPTVRMLVAEVLGELGYAAIEAADGAAGIKVLQSKARVDLLITDVGLPNGMNGRQMADQARVSRPELKVLFITGFAENAVLNHGHLEHGMHVLTKPFSMEVLATRIKGLLDGS